jgi:hypothetical protein
MNPKREKEITQMSATITAPEKPLVNPNDPVNAAPRPKFTRPTYNVQAYYMGGAIGWLGQDKSWVYHYPDQSDSRVLQLAWYLHSDNKNYLTMTDAGWLSYYAGYAGYPAEMRVWSNAAAWNKIEVGNGLVESQVVDTDYKLSQYSGDNTEVYCTNNYTPLQFKFVQIF